MDERGVRAGPAIPGERDRAGWVAALAIERVRHEEHLAVDVAGLIVANRDASRARRVPECPAAHHGRLACRDDGFVLGVRGRGNGSGGAGGERDA